SSHMMLVGVASSQEPGIQRVVPNDPANSYLIHKLEGTAATGGQMPPAGALDATDIATIRQWISDGAVDDRAPASTPIRVSSLSVTPDSTLTAAPTRIIAGFDRELDASTVNAFTFVLEDPNGVGVTATSVSVPAANRQSAVFDLTGTSLADGTYRVVLRGSGGSIIMDLDANALDGEFSGNFPSGNGTAGGDFVVQFTINTPVVINPTLDDIQAAIFTPSCATAGCHDATTQAAGLSLADADTSHLELVGQFSNQNGQSNVLLVAPNDPDNSYLVRKIEGTAGITGGRMPPAAPLPQSEISVIRQWITDGAVR
ncbi:MAG: Ig-like domain-containing protein, partial [Gammaproteobacteria bacterium]|nr:Ig-like domain-containing protein [Gammaproteobacteria bacterium]